MERTVFVQHVLSAVGQLGDSSALGNHPLATLLFPDRPPAGRGRELAELLRSSIGALRPEDRTETNLGANRRYHYLQLRYGQGLRAANVARDLGLSDRQARRVHQDSIEALATLVWTRRQRAESAPASALPTSSASTERLPSSELDVEISRLGATSPVEGTSLGEVLRSALGTVAPLAARHEVGLDVATLPRLPLVAVDRAVLRQVLVNLLVASIETGVSQVAVEARPGRDAVVVSFTARYRQVAFGRPSEPTSHDELLRIVQRLLQLQSGTVEIQTPESDRSVVVLTLPVVQPATVLLVDDNPDTLRLFRRYLSGGSYRPIETTDGLQALDLARQTQPRAIVLDVMLPTRDGWEILQALRNDLATEQIPVIVCSVLHQEELAQALGATSYLAKPVSREALLASLQLVLARQAPSRVRSERAG